MTIDFHTIGHSGWDDEDWGDAQANIGRLAEVEVDLLDKSELAPWLLADTFHIFHQPTPEVTGAVHPRARVNAKIAETIIDEAAGALRDITVGDPLIAGLAVAEFAGHLADLLDAAAQAQQAADDAADAEDQAQQAEQDGEPQDRIDELRAAAASASDRADQELAIAGPGIGSVVRAGIDAANETAQEAAAAFTGWAGDAGTETSIAGRQALLERLSTDRMKELADRIGRLRVRTAVSRTGSWRDGPGEITSVVASDDLSRLTSGEMLYLAVPALRPMFCDRYLGKKLVTFHMEQRVHEHRGSVIVVEDSSGTMFRGTPERAIWARSITMHLLDTAIAQRRGFRAIVFAGTGKFKVFDFGDDASAATFEQRLELAEFVMTGSTDFQGPLLSAMTMLDDENDRTGRTTADVVFVTDGKAECDDEFHEAWDQDRARLGFRCYAVVIELEVTPTVARLADKVTAIATLTDDSDLDVIDIFSAVSQQGAPAHA